MATITRINSAAERNKKGFSTRKGRTSMEHNRARAKLNHRARILKALAHPTRLLMLEMLAKKEKCVSELAEMVGADCSTISKHLSLLRSVGVLQEEKKGLRVYYKVRLACLMDFMKCIDSILEKTAREQLGM